MGRKAFIVGINSHGLQYAENDAVLMRDCLKLYGYETIIAKGAKRDITAEFDKLLDNANQTDTIIVYFSGHGIVERGDLQFVLDDKTSMVSSKINLNEIIKTFESCKTVRHKLVILDCCNAGLSYAHWNSDFLDKYFILASTGKFGKAKELDEINAGFITHRIHQCLVNPPADLFQNDNKLRIVDLHSWLRKEVKTHNADQHAEEVPIPQLFGNFDANFEIAEVSSERFAKFKDIQVGGRPSCTPNLNLDSNENAKIRPLFYIVLALFLVGVFVIIIFPGFFGSYCTCAFEVRDSVTEKIVKNAKVSSIYGSVTDSKKVDSNGRYVWEVPCKSADRFVHITVEAPKYKVYTEIMRVLNYEADMKTVYLNPQTFVTRDTINPLRRGYELLEQGLTDQANQVFIQFRRINPQSPEGYYWQSRVAVAKNNKNVALEYLDRALQRDGNHINSLVLKITLLLSMGGEKRNESEQLSRQSTNLNEILDGWIKCLDNNNFFSSMITSISEIEIKCPPPAYEWNETHYEN